MVDPGMDMADKSTPANGERRLADIIRKVKIAAAEREDVVVDIREADRVRLELLADELRPVIDDVPRDVDLFDFAISSGLQPRFWIDAVAHVHMARDRRTYRFVRDGRLGRVLLAEASDIAPVADAVSTYIGQRLVDRERFLSGDIEDVRGGDARRPPEDPDRGETAPPGENLPGMNLPPPRQRPGSVFIVGLLWFILGCVAGAGILAAAFRNGIDVFLR